MQQKYTHAIPIEHNLNPGPLWEYKHSKEDLDRLRESDPYVHDGQYMQNPAPAGGAIFKGEWWKYYTAAPDFDFRIITADTAQKDKEVNDYTVFQLWGASGRNAYLIDQYRDKIEAPELLQQAIAFWNKHINKQGVLRGMFVEDKVSGTSLIQQIRNEGRFPIIAVQRGTSKVARAFNGVPSIASGLVWLPENADWLFDYKEEFRKITPLMTHKHDDQFDPTMDAIELICLARQDYTGEGHIDDIINISENSNRQDIDYTADVLDQSVYELQNDEAELF